ncbi:MAG TPA: DUF6516 family protein [Candidatus Cybelea sp.]|nr:DUF6516 family protein [Candidatus Cybelea sp.]
MERSPDHSLDQLLELDGEVLFISEDGQYWVKFEVRRVPVSSAKPHGLNYSLTLHGPENERLLGFDNSHPVPPTKLGEPQDHRHLHKTVKPYDYKDAGALLKAFWADVDAFLERSGVRR